MATLREKMKQEMVLIGLAESTQKRYIEALRIPVKPIGDSGPNRLMIPIQTDLPAAPTTTGHSLLPALRIF